MMLGFLFMWPILVAGEVFCFSCAVFSTSHSVLLLAREQITSFFLERRGEGLDGKVKCSVALF